MSNDGVPSKLPDFPDFCLNTPLYCSFPFDASDFQKLMDIEFYKGHLDCYCLDCGRDSVFKHDWKWSDRDFKFYTERQNYIVERYFYCSRDKSHKMSFYFRFHNGTVTKIGQNPSIADIATYDIRKYVKVLGKEHYAEFSRAIGLASHGIGIGSFIYLRRTIEHLIDEAHQTKINSGSWDEDSYTRARMDEKIKLLKDLLPEFLVENRSIYAILSKGVHELAEQECMDSYDVIKVGIELILDEKLAELERKKKTKLAKNNIAKLEHKIRGV